MSSELLEASSSSLAAASDDAIIIGSLTAALGSIAIEVPDGSIQQLLNQRQWIYQSNRVEDLLKKLNQDQLYSVFNYQHHLRAATQMFNFLKNRELCVLYGHKAQGKTQFLFFVFKLLQAMGEKVMFLDRTILPSKENDDEIVNDNTNFCGHLWMDSFLQIGGAVKTTLEQFSSDGLHRSFGIFMAALRKYTSIEKRRIWIIIDEVVLFEKEKFRIQLPEEQAMGPFHWIITGSAGIGSWVGKRHLEKYVLDLPLFTKEECFNLASSLCSILDKNMDEELGVPMDGVDDWLEERFGGVVGYISEMFLEIANGKSPAQYMLELSGRMKTIISNISERRNLSEDNLASVWLREIKSNENRWDCLRNAGLCGSSAPRGVIFTQILKWLFIFYPDVDELELIRVFRSRFAGDPGLDGCLLELEESLKLRADQCMEATLLTLTEDEWTVNTTISLPTAGSCVNVLVYNEGRSELERTSKHSMNSSWALIELPTGFDVIDVVLVKTVTGSGPPPAIYGIQITRSSKPFTKHHTFDTCHPKSKTRLEELWNVIYKHFGLRKSVDKFYVMLAPNCEKDAFRPPAGHRKGYFVSPNTIITADGTSKFQKRTNPSSRKKKKKQEHPNV